MEDLNKEFDIPDDVQESWYKFCRSMQAHCSGNNGIAKLTVEIGVIQTEAISWSVKEVNKIYPSKLTDGVELSDKGIAALLAHLSKST